MKNVDLNSDLGESYGRYTLGRDAEIIPLISSANVACGFHAGDPSVIRETLSLIKNSGNTGLGAHPSYPDRQGFGRRFLDMTHDEVRDMMLYQIAALDGFAQTMGLTLNHVKPHGALYNRTFEDYELAQIIAKTVKAYNPELKLMGLSQQNLVKAGKEEGLQVINEVFADRAYEADGTLVSRRKEGAMITDTQQAVKRVVRMVKEGKVESIDGQDIDIQADSICVHGDGENALEFVQEIIDGLNNEGVNIKTF
jgi:UPF0271 protein